jgi:hypothetical protein
MAGFGFRTPEFCFQSDLSPMLGLSEQVACGHEIATLWAGLNQGNCHPSSVNRVKIERDFSYKGLLFDFVCLLVVSNSYNYKTFLLQ